MLSDITAGICRQAGWTIASVFMGVVTAGSASALPTQAIPPSFEDLHPAQVLRVVDGETLIVRFLEDDFIPGGVPYDRLVKLDIAGIDAPLAEQMHWSYFSGQYLQDRINRQRIDVELIDPPSGTSDLVQAYIWSGNTLVNEEMLNLGHAIFEESPRDTRYLEELFAAQELAQKQGRGVWNYFSPLPQTPEQFRQWQSVGN